MKINNIASFIPNKIIVKKPNTEVYIDNQK